MQIFSVSTFLRRILIADAVTCIGCGLLLTLGSHWLAQFAGVPAEATRYAGLTLFPFAAFLIYMATRKTLSAAGIWTVILLNALWTADSILILFTGWIRPTEFGYIFVLAQAAGVAAFAALEYVGLRKSIPAGS